MEMVSIARTEENENQIELYYKIETQNLFSHESALPNCMLSLKNGFIAVLLCNLDLKNVQDMEQRRRRNHG